MADAPEEGGGGRGPGLLRMIRSVVAAPFEERLAREEAARTRRLALKAQSRTLEQVTRMVRPEDDEFTQAVMTGRDAANAGRGMDEATAAQLRDAAFRASLRSTHAIGYLRSLERFVIGRGPDVTADVEGERLQGRIEQWWEEFRRVNDWNELENEIPFRTWRDGETFVRRFVQEEENERDDYELDRGVLKWMRQVGVDPDESLAAPRVPEGMTLVRLVPPSQIRDPRGQVTHGIVTDAQDVQTVLGYVWAPHGEEVEEVIPSDEVMHVKIRVDSDVKRGRTALEPILKRNRQYEKWLESRIILNYVRSAVVLVRRVEGGTGAQIAQLRSDREAERPEHSRRGKTKAFQPGTTLTPSAGVSYEFKSPNLQASDAQKDGRSILLSMAAATGLPEYLFTGDASNANFASTLVAESPAVREFQSWQDFFEPVFSRVHRWPLVSGAAAGQIEGLSEQQAREVPISVDFPPMIVREELDHTKANQVRHEAGVLSREGWARDEGIDWETERERLERERQEDVEFTAPVTVPGAEFPPPPQAGGGGNGGPPEEEEPDGGEEPAPEDEEEEEEEEGQEQVRHAIRVSLHEAARRLAGEGDLVENEVALRLQEQARQLAAFRFFTVGPDGEPIRLGADFGDLPALSAGPEEVRGTALVRAVPGRRQQVEVRPELELPDALAAARQEVEEGRNPDLAVGVAPAVGRLPDGGVVYADLVVLRWDPDAPTTVVRGSGGGGGGGGEEEGGDGA